MNSMWLGQGGDDIQKKTPQGRCHLTEGDNIFFKNDENDITQRNRPVENTTRATTQQHNPPENRKEQPAHKVRMNDVYI